MSDSAVRPDTGKFTVVYAVVSHQSGAALTLPFFSRLKLKQSARALSPFGYRIALAKIPVSSGSANTKVYKSPE